MLSVDIREMQIESTIWYYYITIRIAKIKMCVHIYSLNVGKDTKKVYYWWEYEMVQS